MVKSNESRAEAKTGTSSTPAGMMAFNPALIQSWQVIMSESARFFADRLQQDLETQKAMLACKTPAELMQVQATFFKTAMEQYTDFGAHLKETVATATEETIKDVRTSQSRGYDDVPL